MPDFGSFRGFGEKLMQGQTPTQLGKIGSEIISAPPILDTYPNAAAAYSLRKLRTAYTGNAIRVRRANDNQEENIGFTFAGDLDVAALSSFCGAFTGTITTWYDQSGNARNATQTTAILQPVIYSSSAVILQKTKPAIQFVNTHQLNFTFPDFNGLSAASLINVSKPNQTLLSNGSRPNIYFNSNVSWGSVFQVVGTDGVTNRFGTGQIGNNNIYTAVITNAIYCCYKNGVNEINTLNGLDINSSSSKLATMSGTTTANIGGLGESATYYNGIQSEIIVYQSDQTTNRAGIDQNINDYYGIY
jgi:hypothetical protein